MSTNIQNNTPWYDSIPTHGIVCWVGPARMTDDQIKNYCQRAIIVRYDNSEGMYYNKLGVCFAKAIPISDTM